MFKLIDPEIWHVVFAIAGAAVGWWLRHRQGGSSVPPEVAEIVQAVLDKRKQQQTQSQLDELLAALKQQKGQGTP
jgi:hypothetical protein